MVLEFRRPRLYGDSVADRPDLVEGACVAGREGEKVNGPDAGGCKLPLADYNGDDCTGLMARTCATNPPVLMRHCARNTWMGVSKRDRQTEELRVGSGRRRYKRLTGEGNVRVLMGYFE